MTCVYTRPECVIDDAIGDAAAGKLLGADLSKGQLSLVPGHGL